MKKFTLWTLVCLFVLHCSSAYAQVDVLTQHNKLDRTGWNNQETVLNTTNVKAGTFGKVFTTDLDDKIYAQPLVVTGVNTTAQGIKDVVYVATVNNTIYAIDAVTGIKIWQKNYTHPGFRPPQSSIDSSDIHAGLCSTYNDFALGKFGIVGTPVIDKSSNTLYVVTRDVDPAQVDKGPHPNEQDYSSNGFFDRLHSIDIRNGNENPGSPVDIVAQKAGLGAGSDGTFVHLDLRRQNQRGGLLLLNGIVYITFASHCDWKPYHGWVIGYDAASLQQKIVYCTTCLLPFSNEGGIWMSGSAPAADAAGNIYVTSGNGGTTPTNQNDRGESVIKLTRDVPNDSLIVSDYFTPQDYVHLNQHDLDLPIQVMLIPSTNMAISGCKDGNLYVMSTVPPGLGHYSTTSDFPGLLQKVNVGAGGEMHSSFAYFGGNTTKYFYQFAEGTSLKAYPVLSNSLDINNIKTGSLGPVGNSGAYMSVSSNGGNPATGVLWATHATGNCNANQSACPGVLRAFNANDITQELWNSDINAPDGIDIFAKMSCPTVANGRVYVGNNGPQAKLMAYGLAASNPCPGLSNVALNPPNNSAVYSQQINFSNDPVNAGKAFDGTTSTGWHCNVDDVPNGTPAYLQIDLGKNYDICSIVLYLGNTNTTDYRVEGSPDAGTFTLLEEVTDAAPAHTLLLSGQTYRYIRFRPRTRLDFQVEHVVNEMEIYGDPTNPCPKPTGVIWSNTNENNGTLSWAAATGALSYNIQYQVAAVTNWRTATSPTNSVLLHAITCGPVDYQYTVQTVCASGTSNKATGTFTTLACTSFSCLPGNRFGHADLGDNNLGLAGHYCYFDDVTHPKEYQVVGAGTGISGVSDAFQYAFGSLAGDEEISAQMKPFAPGDPVTSKGGIMMRDVISFDSRFAFIGFTNTNQPVFEYRTTAGGSVTTINIPGGLTLPYWIKLRKSGTQYIGFVSPSGLNNTWTQVGSIDLGFGTSNVNVGLATTSGSITQLATGTFSNFLEGSSTPLPITLLGFFASNIDNEYVSLLWSTSMETNNDRFEIERSTDGVHFEMIASVKAVGNSNTTQNYSAKDQNPVNGINFYRLKQVDLDGKSSYSQIVTVNFGKYAAPTMFPNPATSFFTVVAGMEPIKEIELYSVAGVRLQLVKNDAANSSIKISSANLSSGVYIVQIRTASNIYKQKLLKQ